MEEGGEATCQEARGGCGGQSKEGNLLGALGDPRAEQSSGREETPPEARARGFGGSLGECLQVASLGEHGELGGFCPSPAQEDSSLCPGGEPVPVGLR